MSSFPLDEIRFEDMSLDEIEALQQQIVAEIHRRQDEEITAYREMGMSLAKTLNLAFEELMERVMNPKSGRKRGRGAATPVPIRYRHPVTGQTWTGRGKMPNWLREEVDAGASIESFKVA